jgi:hypothetical protein
LITSKTVFVQAQHQPDSLTVQVAFIRVRTAKGAHKDENLERGFCGFGRFSRIFLEGGTVHE